LFRAEDEKFEVDMLIDSNVSAMRALEPLNTEIQQLDRLASTSSRAGGLPIQYTVRLQSLSTVHLSAIARIYGDSAPELFDLLRKNPAGTIPVVFNRLREKVFGIHSCFRFFPVDVDMFIKK